MKSLSVRGHMLLISYVEPLQLMWCTQVLDLLKVLNIEPWKKNIPYP